MTVTTEIQELKENLADAYNAAKAKGATMPEVENTKSLASTISSIPNASEGSETYHAMQVMENIRYSGSQEQEEPAVNAVTPILAEIIYGDGNEESGDDSE